MSEEHAREFIHVVEQDAALQQKIDGFDPATGAVEIVKLGAERDLHFSAEEFNLALNAHLKSPDNEITEEELDSVSGGYVAFEPNRVLPNTPHPVYWVKHGAHFESGKIRSFNPQ